MKIDRDVCVDIEIMKKVTHSNRKREDDRSKADNEQMIRGLQEEYHDTSSQ